MARGKPERPAPRPRRPAGGVPPCASAPAPGSLDRARARRVRAQHVPNIERSIAAAVVVKDEDLFFLADRHGDVPMAGGHGYGLYYHDCRFLSGYALTIATESLIPLAAGNRGGYMAIFRLTNRDTTLPGGLELPKQTIGVEWTRLLRGEERRMHDVLTFQNYGGEQVLLPVELALRADFDDIFEVRSLARERHGRAHEPTWTDQGLFFAYDGADGVTRHLAIRFSAPLARRVGTTAVLEIALGPQERFQVELDIRVSESPSGTDMEPGELPAAIATSERTLREKSAAWVAGHTSVSSNSILLDRVLGNCMADLHALRSHLGDRHFFAAGIPWYGTLFGRDSLITALEMLAYDPAIAEQTLRLLADLQGAADVPWREEQPGKILHEFRRGELANLGEVAFGRYFGSVDATPLFLILLAEHACWTGSLALFHDLRPNVEHALAWLSRACEPGYLSYKSEGAHGLLNQGWKDSDDAIMNADGTLAEPPIALVEVQGYLYRALLGMADLYQRACEPARAAELRGRAARLRRTFDRDFWVPELGYYAMAVQANGRRADAIASNPGQALWGGIVPRRRAAIVARRLMAEDMFGGWGVRTLSSKAARFNPIGYHIGTVWPHDNAMIMAGLRRYGLDDAAMRVFMGLFEAATHFDQYRLPELFSGYPREDPGEPVSYPVACHPQAWAAAAIPAMVASLLGLQPNGFDNALRVVRPLLPPFVDRLVLERLRVGRGWVSLRFERTAYGVGVSVLRRQGGVAVSVEPAEG